MARVFRITDSGVDTTNTLSTQLDDFIFRRGLVGSREETRSSELLNLLIAVTNAEDDPISFSTATTANLQRKLSANVGLSTNEARGLIRRTAETGLIVEVDE